MNTRSTIQVIAQSGLRLAKRVSIRFGVPLPDRVPIAQVSTLSATLLQGIGAEHSFGNNVFERKAYSRTVDTETLNKDVSIVKAEVKSMTIIIPQPLI